MADAVPFTKMAWLGSPAAADDVFLDFSLFPRFMTLLFPFRNCHAETGFTFDFLYRLVFSLFWNTGLTTLSQELQSGILYPLPRAGPRRGILLISLKAHIHFTTIDM